MFIQKNQNEEIIIKARQLVGELVFKVLAGKLCVRDALIKFPKDVSDISIQCAWHALIHLEADEDYNLTDYEYRNEQIDFLEMIAFTLQKGEILPENISDTYKEYYELTPLPSSNKFIGKIRTLLRSLM